MKTSKICNNCHATVKENQKFCTQCGTKYEEVNYQNENNKTNTQKNTNTYDINNKEKTLQNILKEKNLKIEKVINSDLMLVYTGTLFFKNKFYIDYINEEWIIYEI